MPTYRKLSTAELLVDERYQRPLQENRVAQIAESFDETLFGVLEVARRNGKCAVFDGQHRLAAAKLVDLEKVPCLVHEELTPEEEAQLFVDLQRKRQNINANDRFKARMFYADPVAVEINQIVVDAGFEIKPNAADAGPDMWRIRAVSALERVYKQHGAKHLACTLVVLRDLWGGDKKSTDGALIEGLALFLKAYEGSIRHDHTDALKEVTPQVLLRRAFAGAGQGGQTLARRVAEEIKKAAGMRGPWPKKRAK